jgi:hypothetical protein
MHDNDNKLPKYLQSIYNIYNACATISSILASVTNISYQQETQQYAVIRKKQTCSIVTAWHAQLSVVSFGEAFEWSSRLVGPANLKKKFIMWNEIFYSTCMVHCIFSLSNF